MGGPVWLQLHPWWVGCRLIRPRPRASFPSAPAPGGGQTSVFDVASVQWTGVRSVPIPAFLVEDLAAFVKGRASEELVFTAHHGGPLWLRNWRPRAFNQALRDAGLTGRRPTPHKLRHTAASLAIAAGADVYVVQTMLGHQKPSITLDTYGHLWPDRLDEVANALNAKRAEHLAHEARKLAD